MSTPDPAQRPAPDPNYVASLASGLTESFEDYELRMSIAEAQTNTTQGEPS